MTFHNPAASLLKEEHQGSRLPSWPRPLLTNKQGKTSKNRMLQRNVFNPEPSNSYDQFGRKISLLEEPTKGDILADQERIDTLERCIEFLKSQHSDTLTHLHREVDRLKAENKEMNFKLVMCSCGTTRSSKSRQGISKRNHRKSTPILKEETKDDSVKLMTEMDTQNVEESLQKERQRNARLMRVVEKLMQRSLADTERKVHKETASLNMLLLDPGCNPSVEECKEVIRHLLFISKQQREELAQLKGDFYQLLHSEDFAADKTQFLSRVQERTAGEEHPLTDKRTVLPQIGKTRNVVKNSGQLSCDKRHQTVHLPTLKPHVSNPISRKQKKTAFLQRTRLGTFPL